MLEDLVSLIEQHPHVPLGYYYPGQLAPESLEDKGILRNILIALEASGDFADVLALQAAVLKEKSELKEAKAAWQWLLFLENSELIREIDLTGIQPASIYKNRLLSELPVEDISEIRKEFSGENGISADLSGTRPVVSSTDTASADHTISLNQYLELVLSESPEMGQIQSRAAQIAAETREQRALFGPSANLGFRYSPEYLSEINEFGFGYRYRSNVGISQSVLPEFRQLRQLRRQENAQSAYTSNLLTQTKQDVMVGATVAYLETAMAAKRAEYTTRLADIANENLALFQRRNQAGEARTLELLEARKQALEAEARAQEAQLTLNTAQVRFQSLLPENYHNITPAQEWIEPKITAENLQVDVLVNQHPSILEYDHLLTLEEIRRNLSKADNFDLDMSLGYNLYGRDELFQSRQWDVRLSAGFPLFMSRIGKSREQQHEAAKIQLQYEREMLATELRQAITEAEQQYLQSNQNKRLLEQDLEIARERVRVIEATIEYGTGQGSNDLLAERYSALKDLLSAELALSVQPYQQSIYYADLLGTAGGIPQTVPIFETASEQPVYQKAIWFYSREMVIASDSTDKIITQLLEHDFSTIYLAIGFPGESYSLFENKEAYAEFINLLRAAGFRVELLMGDGSWLRTTEITSLKDRMDQVMAFYRNHSRFDGIHFDIEPHTLSEWDNPDERPQIISYFPELLQILSDHIKSDVPQLRVSADIPTWFENYRLASWPQEENLLTRTVGIVDQVIIMDYFNRVDKITDEITEELRQAKIYETPVMIGLKVKPESQAFSNTTFYDTGRRTLVLTMDEIYATLREIYPELQGFALYDYQGYFSMKD